MAEPSFGGDTIGRIAALTGQRAPLEVRFGWGASRLNGRGLLAFDGDELRLSGEADGHGKVDAAIWRDNIRLVRRKDATRVELQCLGEPGSSLPGRLRALAFSEPKLADRLMAWAPAEASRTSLVRYWYDYTLGPYRRTAYATYGLLLLITAYYAAQVGAAGGRQDFPLDQLVALGADRPDLTSGGQGWRLFTANFMHGDLGHFVGNMLALLLLAPYVERLFGSIGMLTLFLLTGVLGNAVSQWTAFSTVSVGASGGIFGLFGALLAYAMVRRGQLPMTTILKILVFGGAYALWQFAIGLSDPEVDNTAHVVGWGSGLLLGAVVAPGLDLRRRSARDHRRLGVVAALTIAISLGMVAAVPLRSPDWKLLLALNDVGPRADDVTARCTDLLGGEDAPDLAAVAGECTTPLTTLRRELAAAGRGRDERLDAIRAEIDADLEHRARRYQRAATQLAALPTLRAIETTHLEVLGACNAAVQQAIETAAEDPVALIESDCIAALVRMRQRFVAATDDPELTRQFVAPTLALIEAEQRAFRGMGRAIVEQDETAFAAAVEQIQAAREQYELRLDE